MKKLLYIIIAILLLIVGYQHFNKFIPDPKTITKYINNPIPKEIKQPKDSISIVYDSAPSSKAKKKVFIEATKQRKYIEKVDTKTATIKVISNVSGTLDNIEIQVTEKPKKNRLNLYLGGFTSIPTNLNQPPAIGVNLTLSTPKTLYTIGYDTNQTISVGVAIKIF